MENEMQGYVARMGKMSHAYEILARNLNVISHLGDLGVDERIIMKWILNK